jgi:hypothetical protein
MVSIDDGFIIPILASRRIALRTSTVFIAMYCGIAIGLAIVIVGQLLPVDGVAGLVVRIAFCGSATLVSMAIVWRRSFLNPHALDVFPFRL